MKSKVKVYIQNKQTAIKVPTGTRLLLRRCCNAVIDLEKLEDRFEVNICFVDNKKIRELNLKHRSINKSTDVLSFPLSENGEFDVNLSSGNKQLGDIVISVEKAIRQAEELGHSFQREIAYLTTHSMLHLLGYDHVEGGLEQVKMREKEEAVMAQIGLPRGSSYIFTDEI